MNSTPLPEQGDSLLSNHALCPDCKDYLTPLDTIEGVCSRCYIKKEEENEEIASYNHSGDIKDTTKGDRTNGKD